MSSIFSVCKFKIKACSITNVPKNNCNVSKPPAKLLKRFGDLCTHLTRRASWWHESQERAILFGELVLTGNFSHYKQFFESNSRYQHPCTRDGIELLTSMFVRLDLLHTLVFPWLFCGLFATNGIFFVKTNIIVRIQTEFIEFNDTIKWKWRIWLWIV